MGRKISLVVQITLDDLNTLINSLPGATVSLAEDTTTAKKAAPPKKVRHRNRRNRHNYHPLGTRGLIRSWIEANNTGSVKDIVKHLMAHGYKEKTAVNDVYKYCREFERKGLIVRANGFITRTRQGLSFE